MVVRLTEEKRIELIKNIISLMNVPITLKDIALKTGIEFHSSSKYIKRLRNAEINIVSISTGFSQIRKYYINESPESALKKISLCKRKVGYTYQRKSAMLKTPIERFGGDWQVISRQNEYHDGMENILKYGLTV